MSSPNLSSRGRNARAAKRGGPSRIQGGWSAGGGPQPRRPAPKPIQEESVGESSGRALPPATFAYVPEARRVPKKSAISEDNVVVLRDGIVLLRKAFGLEEQQRWVDMCIEHGTGQVEGVHSFYDGEVSRELGYFDPAISPASSSTSAASSSSSTPAASATPAKKLNLVNKARINVPIALHPPQFTAVAQELVRIAHERCASVPCLDEPNTCRINYYTNSGKIGWHYDRVPSLSKEEQSTVTDPVISMSFGNSAEFQYKQRMDDPEESVILESGDVIIFGGFARMIYHMVPRVIKNTTPKGLDLRQFGPGRFNVGYYYN